MAFILIMHLNSTTGIATFGDNTILSQATLQRKNLLTRFIHQRRLTNDLEVLEGVCFGGESAIFMLSVFSWEVL
jgi:hypothetical protein